MTFPQANLCSFCRSVQSLFSSRIIYTGGLLVRCCWNNICEIHTYSSSVKLGASQQDRMLPSIVLKIHYLWIFIVLLLLGQGNLSCYLCTDDHFSSFIRQFICVAKTYLIYYLVMDCQFMGYTCDMGPSCPGLMQALLCEDSHHTTLLITAFWIIGIYSLWIWGSLNVSENQV